MKRYDQWHHLRIVGDRQLALQYLGEGRKYLGLLHEQLQYGGQMPKLERRNAEGVLFTAEKAGEQYLLTIDVSGKPDKASPLFIEGFIGRPSPATNQEANTDKNHVLLRPGEDGWEPVFFDDTFRPEALDDAGLYARMFPDGIGRYGNVDWRSADESVFISWMGPAARYTGQSPNVRGADKWVFLRGQVLLDTTNTDHMDTLGLSETTCVKGACLRLIGGRTWLYVVLRGTGSTGAQYLARFPLASRLQRRVQYQFDAPTHWFIDAAIVPTGAELLWTAAFSTHSNGVHPFMFNSAGTEARRIHLTSTQALESRLVETEGVWSLTTLTNSYTRTDTTERVRSTFPPGSYAVDFRYGNLGVVTFTANETRDHPASADHPNGPVEEVDFEPVNSTITYTEASSAEKVPFAVDYWGGAWRYAYGYLRNRVLVSDKQMTSNIVTSTVRVIDYPGEPTYDEDTVDGTVTVSVTEQRTGISGGIKTDFIDLPLTPTHSVTGGYSYEHHGHTALTGVSWGPSSTWDITSEVTLSAARTTTTEALALYFLDLRFDTIYYKRTSTSSTTEYEGSGSGAEHFDGTTINVTGDFPVDFSGDLPIDLSFSQDTTLLVRALINGVAVLDEQETVNDSSFTDATTLPAPDWLQGFYFPVLTATQYSTSTAHFVEFLGMQFDESYGGGLYWHTMSGAADGGGLTTPDNLTSAWTTSVGPSGTMPTVPSTDSITTTYDFPSHNVDVIGSWIPVRGAWIVDQANPTTRPSSLSARSLLSSHPGLPGILSTIPSATRYTPVSYLCKTIAIAAPPETP